MLGLPQAKHTALSARLGACFRKPLYAVPRSSAMEASNKTEVFTAALGKLPGVVDTRVGYTGGRTPNPTYDSVCRGDGHTEALRVWFDPTVTSYDKMLEEFFRQHNPTYGKSKAQYKSAIWYDSEEQKEAAERAIAAFSARKGGARVYTDLEPAKEWYDAEDYHQKYMFGRGG